MLPERRAARRSGLGDPRLRALVAAARVAARHPADRRAVTGSEARRGAAPPLGWPPPPEPRTPPNSRPGARVADAGRRAGAGATAGRRCARPRRGPARAAARSRPGAPGPVAIPIRLSARVFRCRKTAQKKSALQAEGHKPAELGGGAGERRR